MSKLGIIAPPTLVQFFKSLGVETIESDSDRASAVAITNAVSAAPGGVPLFPILVHGGLDFSGANAWLRAMTVTRGYRIVVLGGDAEKFANAGDVVHIPLPASMQEVFQQLDSLAGISANNRFADVQVQEDYGIVNLGTGVPESPAAPAAEAEDELPSDLFPAAPVDPVPSAPVADAPAWVQAATPAQQPVPQSPVSQPVPEAPAPAPATAPAWATAPAEAQAPAPMPEPPVVEPQVEEPVVQQVEAPAPLPHDFYPAPTPAPVQEPEAPVYEAPEQAAPAPQAPAPQSAVPVTESGRPLTRRELAARAAAEAAQAAPEAAPEATPEAPAAAAPQVPSWASGQVEPMSVGAEPISTPPAAETKPVTTAIPFSTGPAEQQASPAPSGPRPIRVFDPNLGAMRTEAPAEQGPEPQVAESAPAPSVPEPVAPVAEPSGFDAPPVGEPVAVPGWASAPAPMPEATPQYDAPAPEPQYEAPQPAYEAPQPVHEVPAPVAQTPVYQNAPAYTEPPAYVAPVLETPAPSGPRANIIASFAAKGGVTKTTSALVMADKAARAGLRTVIIDMDKGQDNVGSYMRLRSASLPTIFDAAASGNPAAALVTPNQYKQYRNEASGTLDFAVVFGPGNAHASNHPSLTSQVYRNVIDFAAANSDLVILDMQILKADKSASRLFYDVVLPLLKAEAWGLGIIDQSRPGMEDLEARLKELQREGLTRDRMLIMAANTVNFNEAQAQSLTKRFRTFGDFVGAVSRDDAFKAQLNVGRIPSDNPAVSATMDSVLLRVTGNQAFAPQEKKKKRRGLFGR